MDNNNCILLFLNIMPIRELNLYRSMPLKGCTISNVKLNGIYITCGQYITDYLSDDEDIDRQRRTLFVQGNIIWQKFNMCSFGCETHTLSYLLFTYVYSTTLVELQKSTITKLQIAYHNIFFMFLGMSKYESTMQLPMHTF